MKVLLACGQAWCRGRPDSKRDRQGLRTRCRAENDRSRICARSEARDVDTHHWMGRGDAACTTIPIDFEPVTTFIRRYLCAPVHLRGASLGDTHINNLRGRSRLRVCARESEAARRYLEHTLWCNRQADVYGLWAILDRAGTRICECHHSTVHAGQQHTIVDTNSNCLTTICSDDARLWRYRKPARCIACHARYVPL